MIRGAIGTDPSSCTSNRDGNASENTRLGRDNGARRPQDPFKIAEPSMTIYRPTMTRKRSPPPPLSIVVASDSSVQISSRGERERPCVRYAKLINYAPITRSGSSSAQSSRQRSRGVA